LDVRRRDLSFGRLSHDAYGRQWSPPEKLLQPIPSALFNSAASGVVQRRNPVVAIALLQPRSTTAGKRRPGVVQQAPDTAIAAPIEFVFGPSVSFAACQFLMNQSPDQHLIHVATSCYCDVAKIEVVFMG
jgi:hypothetical protein